MTRVPLFRALLLGAAVAVAGCASATDRFEQGRELEVQGRWDAAVNRYAQALEKDPGLVDARDRLVTAGDSAVANHLLDRDFAASQGDFVRAAESVFRADNILARARSVGVRLSVPGDYTQTRRSTFDGAIEALFQQGDMDRERGRYRQAMNAYRSIRGSYEPLPEQRSESFWRESETLLGWSELELESGRLRTAYDLAAEVHTLEQAPPEVGVAADRVMEEAVAAGRVEVMALPLVVGGRVRDPGMLEMEARVNDLLMRGPWQNPPPFIYLTEDRIVRDVVREASVLGRGLQPAALGLLMRLVDNAEYGVWMELLSLEAQEFDVDQRTRTVQTRDGRSTAYILEDGERRVRAEARVLIVDRAGNAVSDGVVMGTASGDFIRGLYEGDVRELNLSRREIDYFDRVVLDAQDQAILQILAEDLAAKLSVAVFDPILNRIP